MVGDDAVDLFRHSTVVAAQPGFDVADADAELACGDRAGEGRVDIAGDHDEVGRELGKGLFELLRSRLRRPRVELDVRPWQRQLCEEHVAEECVVVLARVDEALLDAPTCVEGGVDRRDLDVVRARADDVDDELSRHQRSASSSGTRAVPGVRSTWRSCHNVNARSPQSWRLRSSRPPTWSSSRRWTTCGSKNPCRSSAPAESVSRAKGSSSPRGHAAAGIEKPRFFPCTISRGSSGAAALRNSTFFARPRTLWRAGSASARFVTTVSRYGTRASSECAIDARSVFTRRSSARYVPRSTSWRRASSSAPSVSR